MNIVYAAFVRATRKKNTNRFNHHPCVSLVSLYHSPSLAPRFSIVSFACIRAASLRVKKKICVIENEKSFLFSIFESMCVAQVYFG